MVKKFVFVVLALILVVGLFGSVFADLSDLNESEEVVDEDLEVEEAQVVEQMEKVVEKEIVDETEDYVKNFVSKKGIAAEQITNVSKVDFNDLPKEVNIENIDDTNLAIYQVDYEEEAEEQKVFVVTYSVEELKAQGDLIIAHDKRQFLNFGFAGESSESVFLKTATGVEGSLEIGYVMMRSGSITGISTSMGIVEPGTNIEIIIYKNGEAINFGNTIDADSTGVKKDYDVQSNEVVTFEPGDVISAYVTGEGTWRDAITMVEITTIN